MKDARDILVEAAACNMGYAVYIAVADDIENLLHIYPGRSKSHFPEDSAAELRI